jgi:hypothetical protein
VFTEHSKEVDREDLAKADSNSVPIPMKVNFAQFFGSLQRKATGRKWLDRAAQ